MQDLKVTLVQTQVKWEDIDFNLSHFENLINQSKPQTDLILLPETFPTGFTMNSQSLAQDMQGTVVNWMKKMSQECNCAIGGSAIIREDQKIYNRFLLAKPGGELHHYDKRHLFRMADENQHFQQGQQRTIVELKGWKLNLQVCYDLRFPVWSRNKYAGNEVDSLNAEYDLLMYVANWPMVRVEAWNTLLKARAIENQCYVIGLNRIGKDGANVDYNGNSCVIDPKGVEMAKLPNIEQVETCTLSLDELNDFRKKFPVGLDAD